MFKFYRLLNTALLLGPNSLSECRSLDHRYNSIVTKLHPVKYRNYSFDPKLTGTVWFPCKLEAFAASAVTMTTVSDRLNMNGETKCFRLGDTFNNAHKSSGSTYHTIRYGFKPQSIDTEKMGTVEIGEKHNVTVTLPHKERALQPQTVFEGNEKPAEKDCLLIIDHTTGEIFLEKFLHI